MVRRWLALCLLAGVFLPSPAGADELIVTSNHATIGSDKTLQLAVRMTGGDADFTLDTSPLQKDFYVIPNGSGHKAGQWMEKRFQLGPRHTGRLQVPVLTALRNGKRYNSHPFTVNVAAVAGDVDDARLWIETHVDRNTVWQRQQLVYSFSVFSTNDMVTPRLTQPDFKGFSFETVQENVREERIMGGIRVQVVHYKYLLFPQQSGTLDIDGPTMRATLLQTEKSVKSHAGQASFGDDRRILRPKVAHGAELHIRVRPLPVAAQALPVGQLNIQSTISEGKGYAGEPLTWVVTLHGSGMQAASLPDVRQKMHVSSTFKTYPEAPDISLKKDRDRALASGIWRVVVLPQQAGEMALPAIVLPYFDPVSGRIEKAASRPIDVHILPARQAQNGDVFRANPSQQARGAPMMVGYSGGWRWLALALFLLWLATLALWLKPLSRLRALSGNKHGKRPSLRWVQSAPDALQQFERIKQFIGVPASLSPLGLLQRLPGIEGGEAGAWLTAIEKGHYASGALPGLLDAAALQEIKAAADRLRRTAEGGMITPQEFGRIGG